MVNVTADDLGISPPTLHWIKSLPYGAEVYDFATDREVLGLYQPASRRIGLRADTRMSVRKLLSIVAHEVRHAGGGDEPEAQAYERQWFDRLTPGDGH